MHVLHLNGPPFDFFVQLVAALLFYQKEFFCSRLIGIAFFELPGLAGGFRYTKIAGQYNLPRMILFGYALTL